MSLINALDVGTTALVAQSLRLNLVSSNLANADSVTGPQGEPYRARMPVFAAMLPRPGALGQGVEVAQILESQAPPRLEYRPGHPMADEAGYVRLPNVNPVEQMVDMISASRSYQLNVDMMNVTRQLMFKTLDLIK